MLRFRAAGVEHRVNRTCSMPGVKGSAVAVDRTSSESTGRTSDRVDFAGIPNRKVVLFDHGFEDRTHYLVAFDVIDTQHPGGLPLLGTLRLS